MIAKAVLSRVVETYRLPAVGAVVNKGSAKDRSPIEARLASHVFWVEMEFDVAL
jgi:hypothetical protein